MGCAQSFSEESYSRIVNVDGRNINVKLTSMIKGVSRNISASMKYSDLCLHLAFHFFFLPLLGFLIGHHSLSST